MAVQFYTWGGAERHWMSFVLIACTFTPFPLPRHFKWLLLTDYIQIYKKINTRLLPNVQKSYLYVIITIGCNLLIFTRFISNLLSWLWFLLFADVWMLFDSASWLLLPGSVFPLATKSKEPTGLMKLPAPSKVRESLETGHR